MEDKHSFGDAMNAFIAGKGFYIVLLLCAGLVAASIWLLASGSGTVQEASETAETQAAPAGAVPAMWTEIEVPPTATPLPPNVPVMAEPSAPAVAEEPLQTQAEETEEAVEADSMVYGLRDYYLWPVNGTVDRGCSTETLSYDATMRDWRVHAALDIAAPEGTEVLAATNGTVAAVYSDTALGSVVEIDHADGVRSLYANLAAETMVRVGDAVKVGDPIGTVGRTAMAESGAAPHLHFAMSVNGETVDPTDILPRR